MKGCEVRKWGVKWQRWGVIKVGKMGQKVRVGIVIREE